MSFVGKNPKPFLLWFTDVRSCQLPDVRGWAPEFNKVDLLVRREMFNDSLACGPAWIMNFQPRPNSADFPLHGP